MNASAEDVVSVAASTTHIQVSRPTQALCDCFKHTLTRHLSTKLWLRPRLRRILGVRIGEQLVDTRILVKRSLVLCRLTTQILTEIKQLVARPHPKPRVRKRTVLQPREQPLWQTQPPHNKEIVLAHDLWEIRGIEIHTRPSHDDLRVFQRADAQVMDNVFGLFTLGLRDLLYHRLDILHKHAMP